MVVSACDRLGAYIHTHGEREQHCCYKTLFYFTMGGACAKKETLHPHTMLLPTMASHIAPRDQHATEATSCPRCRSLTLMLLAHVIVKRAAVGKA